MKKYALILGGLAVLVCLASVTAYGNYQNIDKVYSLSEGKTNCIKESSLPHIFHIEKTETIISLFNNPVKTLQTYSYHYLEAIKSGLRYSGCDVFVHNFFFEEDIRLSLCKPDIIYPFHYFF